MAVGNNFDISDEEEEPQYPSDFEECPVDDLPDDEDNNNHKPQIVIPNNDPVVYYSEVEEEEEEPGYIDDILVYDNNIVAVNEDHNDEIMISREDDVVDYFDYENMAGINFGEVEMFGVMSEEEDEQEEEFVNGLVNVDDFEYEFEFVDDNNNEVKGLNSVVRDFPDGFGQTGSVMYEKRKVSAVRDFPNGFGSLEEVQEKSVQDPPVKKRKTFDDKGSVVVLGLQAPQFCPWRDKNGCLKKARSRVSRRGN